jgi:division/cell wall cluster transcriptional repressor MraZ
MARLISRFLLTIDEKGRLVLPAAHRGRYEEGAILSPKTDHIAIYEPSEWDRFVEQLKEHRLANEIAREDFNWITMNAADPRPDSAGRILIPGWMRDQMGLDREVMIGGAHEYLGIYKADYVTTIDPSVATRAAARVDQLGL